MQRRPDENQGWKVQISSERTGMKQTIKDSPRPMFNECKEEEEKEFQGGEGENQENSGIREPGE